MAHARLVPHTQRLYIYIVFWGKIKDSKPLERVAVVRGARRSKRVRNRLLCRFMKLDNWDIRGYTLVHEITMDPARCVIPRYRFCTGLLPPNRSVDLISDGGWTYRTSFHSLYGQFDLSAWLIIAFQRSLSPPPFDYAKQPPPITGHASSKPVNLDARDRAADHGYRLSYRLFSHAWL